MVLTLNQGNLLGRLMTPPAFADEDKTRTARLLHIIILAASSVLLIWTLSIPLVYVEVQLFFLYSSVFFLVISVSWILNRRGHVLLAGHFLSWMLWISISCIIWTGGGTANAGVMTYGLIILVAGFIVNITLALVIAGLSVLFLSFAAYAETVGFMPEPRVIFTPLSNTVTYGLLFVLIWILVYNSISSLRQALLRARTKEREAVENYNQFLLSQERLNNVVTGAPIVLVAVDRDGNVTLAEGNALANMGFEPEKMKGQSVFEIFADYPQVMEDFRRALAGDMLTSAIELKDYFFECWLAPIKDKDGAITGGTCVATDISARVKTAAQLEQYVNQLAINNKILARALEQAENATTAKGDFMASMSHELRTPLNSVIGFANVLLKNKSKHFTRQEITYIERIIDNGQHLLELINDVLDLSKVEAGQLELVIEDVELNQLVTATISQMASQVKGKDIMLQTELPPHEVTIFTDSFRLKQVLINLVGNAIKFTEKGTVTVSVLEDENADGSVELEVADTGIGISKDRFESIFDFFQQGDSSTSRGYGGTGLGLAICRSLCELMGCNITVESEVGRGSTFTVYFDQERAKRIASVMPHEKKAEASLAPHEIESAVAETLNGNVLVVDDNAEDRLTIAGLLKDLELNVIEAASGSQGLSLARERHPDLVLLELLMPGMNGWEFLKELKSDNRLQDIPVVIVSVIGSDSKYSIPAAASYLDKPIQRDSLYRTIRKYLYPFQ